MRPARRALLALALAAPLAACEKLFSSKSTFNGIDVTGSNMGGELRLADHDGRQRSLAEFRGKAVVVVFGFTHCPDVCPTALSDLASALKALGPDGGRVQVLFVTVDPKRDRPELMRQFVLDARSGNGLLSARHAKGVLGNLAVVAKAGSRNDRGIGRVVTLDCGIGSDRRCD